MLHNIIFEMLAIPFAEIMVYAAVILTLISGIDYFIKNKHVIKNTK
jgi:CDP-diacylglycerol--glycerol-3-phosphate 3-phosphatidyltransferase